jgi:hypothetical protein
MPDRVKRARRQLDPRAHDPPHPGGDQLGSAGLVMRHPGLAVVLDWLGHRSEIEEDRCEIHARDAVDHRVVRLGDQREAPLFEALDQPHLPQRLGAVQALGEDPRGQQQQLLLGAGVGQRGVADVVLEVEARIVDPQRHAHLDRRKGELLAVARDEVQARSDVVDEVLVGRSRALEDRQRADVHVRRRVLLGEEGGVDGGQPVEVLLRHGRSVPAPASSAHAHVDVNGRSIAGDAVAGATAALLRGGALDHALQVVKDEVERQANAHLSGERSSLEFAAIGRRTCEPEWDPLAMLA